MKNIVSDGLLIKNVMSQLSRTPSNFANEISSFRKSLANIKPQSHLCNYSTSCLYQPLFTAKCFYNDLFNYNTITRKIVKDANNKHILGFGYSNDMKNFSMALVNFNNNVIFEVFLFIIYEKIL